MGLYIENKLIYTFGLNENKTNIHILKIVSRFNYYVKDVIKYIIDYLDTDKDIIKTIDDNICFFPEVPNDIIVYRGGKMKIKNRPYLSGTFLYDVGFNYSNGNIKNLHKIIVKKGARIIPLYPFNKLYNFADPEMEIILDSSRLTKKLNYYIYK